MEKLFTLIPSILGLVIICFVTMFFDIWLDIHIGKNKLNSLKWHKKNMLLSHLNKNFLKCVIGAPAIEEVIFRAPLIIAFETLSPVAWFGIFISGALFSISHWPGTKITTLDILSASTDKDYESDDVEKITKRIEEKNKKLILKRKVSQCLYTLALGILFGYCGVKYQSIWAAFAAHVVWNLLITTASAFMVWLAAIVRNKNNVQNHYP